ncbi:TetR family transcriptional regulator [Microbacterium sediminicola]|uniref:TetR family transcriptional regulator n=1 Tax=Microbacterium sediminicola TaxID=415210 RepID=A0ABN2HNJ1_9MICO
MSESAVSLREQRVRETERALRRRARELTAEGGLGGFTVDELCTDVGVSRRTFFNYFATKENAVLGLPVRADSAEQDRAFVEGSGDLLDDLVVLLVARWESSDMTRDEIPLVFAAVEREPALHRHFMAHLLDAERSDAALIVERQGWALDDDRALLAVRIVGALMKSTGEEFFRSDGETAFVDILRRHLSAARALFAAA